jgi:hypothetical protein
MGEILEDVLGERVSIREGDKIRRVSRREAIMLALTLKAMKGDVKAAMALIALGQRIGEFETKVPELRVVEHIIVDPKDPSDD